MARFITPVALRWSDMDAFGHVNNCRYLTVLEEARVGIMFNAAVDEGIDSFAAGIVVARHEIDYLLPVHYTQKVEVQLWVDRIGGASFTLAYEVMADGKLAARAKTIMVPFDVKAEKSRRLSPQELDFLHKWQDD
ncbi:acyl-CoA thioesterase [Natronoglycomyces albus]|uniref:Acyl-CoA thioesterase n=1 Tax=Natronoglycomyces albus TaxID=2811108 RepID=A0A895XUR3_9ACTN|nr:thioesterase family protein [Natronoglycomyces albus]QSB06266.1 acyl-CoA thioesterase [Natronoglycomyces albus]